MSVTTPVEYTLSRSGNVKSFRKLRNSNPSSRPRIGRRTPFNRPGSIISRAYRAGPLNPDPTHTGTPALTPSDIQKPSRVPMPVIEGMENQGDADSGGGVVTDQVAEKIQAGAVLPVGGENRGAKKIDDKKGKQIMIFGGIGVAAIIVLYFLFFNKRKNKRRRR
jgi:hypothetical protein